MGNEESSHRSEVCFPTGDVSAARYDKAERIPMIGVVRRGRGGPNNAKVRPTRDERLELNRQYNALKGEFKSVLRVYKSVASMRTWREILLKEYEWLPADPNQSRARSHQLMFILSLAEFQMLL